MFVPAVSSLKKDKSKWEEEDPVFGIFIIPASLVSGGAGDKKL